MVKTCRELMDKVREETELYSNTVLFDGYSGETCKPRGQKILPLLNEALGKMKRTGFNKCEFRIPLVLNQGQYLMDSQIGDIDTVWIESVDGLNRHNVSIRRESYLLNNTGARFPMNRGLYPTAIYQIGTRGIGIDRVPTASGLYVIVMRAYASVSPLSSPDDVPGQVLDDSGSPIIESGVRKSILPEEFMYMPAYFAAASINSKMGKVRRAAECKEMYQSMYTELQEQSQGRFLHANSELGLVRLRRS